MHRALLYMHIERILQKPIEFLLALFFDHTMLCVQPTKTAREKKQIRREEKKNLYHIMLASIFSAPKMQLNQVNNGENYDLFRFGCNLCCFIRLLRLEILNLVLLGVVFFRPGKWYMRIK